jgi:hypothetical protein
VKPLSELRIMGVRNFRSEFTTLAEPVVVISRNEIKGVWVPGTEALDPSAAAHAEWLRQDLVSKAGPRPASVELAEAMAQGPVLAGDVVRPFRPAPKPGAKKR